MSTVKNMSVTYHIQDDTKINIKPFDGFGALDLDQLGLFFTDYKGIDRVIRALESLKEQGEEMKEEEG